MTGLRCPQNITDMVGRQLGELSEGVALVVDTLSQCEPLAVDVLCKVADRSDLEAAEQMRLVTVERSGNERMARLAHPLFGELRRASAGEMYLSRIRGKLAQGLGERPDADIQSTVRRALLTLESDLSRRPRALRRCRPLRDDAAGSRSGGSIRRRRSVGGRQLKRRACR